MKKVKGFFQKDLSFLCALKELRVKDVYAWEYFTVLGEIEWKIIKKKQGGKIEWKEKKG